MKRIKKVIALLCVFALISTSMISASLNSASAASEVVTKYEAEANPILTGNAQIETKEGASGGKVVGYLNAVGNSVQINNVVAGNILTLHFACWQAGKIGMYINDEPRIDIDIPDTGDWGFKTYVDFTTNIDIPANSSIRVQFDEGDTRMNLDYIIITSDQQESSPSVVSVAVSPETQTIVQGGTQLLTAAVVVENGADQTVTWSTSDPKVSVSVTGLVSVAVDAPVGDYTITATSIADGTKKGISTISVIPATVTENPNTHSGSWSTKMTMTGTPTWNGLHQEVRGLTPGAIYVLKAWVKGEGKISMEVKSGDWSTVDAVQDFYTQGGWPEWTEITVPVTVSQGKVQINIKDGSNSPALAYIDDVFFGPVGGSNLLVNGDFESGDTKWDKWKGSDPNSVPSCEIVQPPIAISNPNTHSGLWSVKADQTGTASWSGPWQDIQLTEGTTYVFKTWIKGSGKVALIVQSPGWAGIGWKEFTATDVWQEISITFTAAETGVYHPQIHDTLNGGTPGVVYIDDFFLGTAGGGNILANSDFEEGNTGWTNVKAPFSIIKSSIEEVNNSTISPSNTSFDLNDNNLSDITVDMALNGNTLSEIKNGATTLVPDTDYSVDGSTVTIKNSYLKTLNIGAVGISFKFSAGDAQIITINVFSTEHSTTATFGKASIPVTIDGIVETDENGPMGDWESAGLCEISGTVDENGNSKSAKVYFKYDYNYLYIGAKIKDPTPMINSNTGSNIWNGDNLEIFLGCEDLDYTVYPDKTGAMLPTDVQLVISSGIDNGYQFYTNINNVFAFPKINMEIVEDVDHKGYTIEVAVPLSALNIQDPWNNRQMILNTVLNEGGSSKRGQWGWTTNTEGDKKKRGLWGLVSFEPAAAPADEITVFTSVSEETNMINVTGQAINIQQENVTLLVKDPNGAIAHIDQTVSDAEGYYSFTFPINNAVFGSGTYVVNIGGTGIYTINGTAFDYDATVIPRDTTAPSAPTGLGAVSKTETTVDISWTAATDNVGVIGYNVYNGSTLLNIEPIITTAYKVTGLTAGTTYTFSVKALDAEGNESESSDILSVATNAAQIPEDTTAPTAPTGLKVVSKTEITVDLSWTAATDNVRVTGYNVYNGSNLLNIEPVIGTSYKVIGLIAGTTYTFSVKALDAAGNISEPSNILFVTTDATQPDTPEKTPTPTTVPTPTPGSNLQVKSRLNGTVAEGSVNSETLKTAFENTKIGNNGVKTVRLVLEEIEGASEYLLVVPVDVFSGKSNERKVEKSIEIQTSLATITVQDNMFGSKDLKSSNNIGFTVAKADISGLSDGDKAKIGDKPVIELNVTVDGKVISWENKNAPVALSIDYKPTAKELKNTDSIVVWYIDGQGRINSVPSGKYDSDTGKVTFTTTHFSKYAVAYNFKTFTDSAKFSWAKEQIEFVATKGIMSGINNDTFNPEVNITRAEFIDTLVKTLGLSAEIKTNFIDVKENGIYSESIGIAKELGITAGCGNNKFNPDSDITRQEMATLVIKALALAGDNVTKGSISDLNRFDDVSKIADYALENMASIVKEGILVGDGKSINPLGKVTRAQTAVIMYKLYNK